MHALLPQMDVNIVRSLVFTLLHTLWQAAGIVAVLSLLLRLIPAGRASLRYALCSLGLIAVLLAAGMTWAVLDPAPASPVADESFRVSAFPAAVDSRRRECLNCLFWLEKAGCCHGEGGNCHDQTAPGGRRFWRPLHVTTSSPPWDRRELMRAAS